MEIANKTINVRAIRFYKSEPREYRIDGFLYINGTMIFFFKVYGKTVDK